MIVAVDNTQTEPHRKCQVVVKDPPAASVLTFSNLLSALRFYLRAEFALQSCRQCQDALLVSGCCLFYTHFMINDVDRSNVGFNCVVLSFSDCSLQIPHTLISMNSNTRGHLQTLILLLKFVGASGVSASILSRHL